MTWESKGAKVGWRARLTRMRRKRGKSGEKDAVQGGCDSAVMNERCEDEE
jgi:hypothetical protein